MTHSRRSNGQTLRAERDALRLELTRLRAENARLRGALVDEVLADVQSVSDDARAQACAPSTGC